MGHYDSSRPGYCPACGAAPGNMKNGKCQFCATEPNPIERAKPEKPARATARVEALAAKIEPKKPEMMRYEVNYLNSFSGTIDDLLSKVTMARTYHGGNAKITFDAGANNIQVYVEVPRKSSDIDMIPPSELHK